MKCHVCAAQGCEKNTLHIVVEFDVKNVIIISVSMALIDIEVHVLQFTRFAENNLRAKCT